MRYRIHSHRKIPYFLAITVIFTGKWRETLWSSDCWFIWLVNETKPEGAVSVDTAQCGERNVLNGVFDRRLNGAQGGYNPQTWLRVDLGVDGHRVSVFTAYVRICLATAHCHWHKRREFTELCVRARNMHPASFDVLLTVHLSIFALVINQLDAQNLVLQWV